MTVRAEADRLLQELGRAISELQLVQGQADAALADLRRSWGARLQPLADKAGRLHRDLLVLEKANRVELFGEAKSARLALAHGALLYELTEPVKRVRSLTPEVLEDLGFPEAVKVAKSVDWGELETWPLERLILVGTERTRKESFTYEINQRRGPAGPPAQGD